MSASASGGCAPKAPSGATHRGQSSLRFCVLSNSKESVLRVPAHPQFQCVNEGAEDQFGRAAAVRYLRINHLLHRNRDGRFNGDVQLESVAGFRFEVQAVFTGMRNYFCDQPAVPFWMNSIG